MTGISLGRLCLWDGPGRANDNVGTMVLLRCWNHRRPGASSAGRGLAEARLAGSGDPSVPFKCGSSIVEQVI